MIDKPSATSEPSQPKLKAICSDELFLGSREVLIVHQNEVYRLRITRQDKLILTK